MTDHSGLRVKGEDQQIREAELSDIIGSEPTHSDNPLIERGAPLTRGEHKVPEELRQSAREDTLARKVREEYDEGVFVVMDKRTPEVVDVVDDLQEARDILDSLELSPEDTLIISCHE